MSYGAFLDAIGIFDTNEDLFVLDQYSVELSLAQFNPLSGSHVVWFQDWDYSHFMFPLLVSKYVTIIP